MKKLLALALAAAPLFAQPATTRIVDTIYDQFGNLYSGALTITLAASSVTVSGDPVLSVNKTLYIRDGALSVALVPTDTAVPSGTAYVFTFGTGDTRTCVVPTSSSPITLAAACATAGVVSWAVLTAQQWSVLTNSTWSTLTR